MTVPELTESDVRRIASEPSFQRGEEYYAAGAVSDLEQRGNVLTGRVEGSQYEPYRVTITLGPLGIEEARCSCPYDWGGVCKHIVATLLTLVRKPNAVQQLAPVEKLLAQRSREDLIVLVQEMIAEYPDLARLLNMPALPDSSVELDLAQSERQVLDALSQEEADQASRSLKRLVQVADRYLRAGDPVTAGSLHHLILAKALDRFKDWWLDWDDDGAISDALSACAEGLGKCLASVEDAETRRPWLEALLQAELKEILLGGVDFIVPAGELVLKHATEEEWGWVEERVHREIKKGSGGWVQMALVDFLTERLKMTGQESLADDLVLAHGTPQQRASLLAELGRVEEAVAIARQHFVDLPGLVLDFANRLQEAGHREAAGTYMATQVDSPYGVLYRPWLARHFEEQGNPSAALELWCHQFRETPLLETYQRLRSLGQEVGVWDHLRPTLLEGLQPERHATLMIYIALDEGNVAWALEIASQPKAWLNADAFRRVAQAAEADHPRAALEIYRAQAEKAIASRNRVSYREAADDLKRVRALRQRLGEESVWQDYISRLREEHRRLRALKEELDNARL